MTPTTIRPAPGVKAKFGGVAIGQVTGRGGLGDGMVMRHESRSAILHHVEEWMKHSRPGDFFSVTIRRES